MGIRRDALPGVDDHFTLIPNDWLRDRRLSRRARGLLAELMSHRVGWLCSIASLTKTGPEGKDALRAAIHELEAAGYLERVEVRIGGRFNEVDYKLTMPAATTEGAKPANGGFTANGETDIGESDTKKNIPLEDQDLEPPLFCSKHPNGGIQCGPCKDAKRLNEKWLRDHVGATKPTVSGIVTPKACKEHGYPTGDCPTCDVEVAA